MLAGHLKPALSLQKFANYVNAKHDFEQPFIAEVPTLPREPSSIEYGI